MTNSNLALETAHKYFVNDEIVKHRPLMPVTELPEDKAATRNITCNLDVDGMDRKEWENTIRIAMFALTDAVIRELSPRWPLMTAPFYAKDEMKDGIHVLIRDGLVMTLDTTQGGYAFMVTFWKA